MSTRPPFTILIAVDHPQMRQIVRTVCAGAASFASKEEDLSGIAELNGSPCTQA